MQPFLVLALITIASVAACVRDVLAAEQPLNQCLRLGSEIGATNLLDSYATTVHEVTRQVLTGNVGYALGFVDNRDTRGNGALDSNPKQVLVYPTTQGLFVVRIVDLPQGLGLHGPF